MRKNLYRVVFCITLLTVIGCASRTKIGLGPASIGGDVEAHAWKPLSASAKDGRVELGTGLVTIGAEAKWKKCNKMLSFETRTGATDAVGGEEKDAGN